MNTQELIKKLDYRLLGITGFLLAAGLIMVFSASSVMSIQSHGNSSHYFQRQLLFIVLGGVAIIVCLKLPNEYIKKFATGFFILSVLSTILVIIPGIGVQRGGAVGWLYVAGFGLQPSEMLKLSYVIFLANRLSLLSLKEIQSFKKGFVPYVVLLALCAGLLLLQRDFGSVVTLSFVVFVMFFLAGTRISFLVFSTLAFLLSLVPMVLLYPYRISRILSFLDPWSDKAGSGYQIIQSYVAFQSGGFFGQGLGAGNQKLFYLPAGHTDFIFSVVAEELGFLGGCVIITAFFIFFWLGMKKILKIQDSFSRLLAYGIIILFVINVVINLFVVMGLLPTKGLTLPLLSAGGSSLIMNMIGIGLLLNIFANNKG